ncbi:N-acetyltransferase family protein [Egicoccus sp. AB-alg2]|uniref:GNAT family N-acetyltransferase n=1 Tax=Egicoccus sp. AB-alg2 TaxID=3242693 RepID=UPI00359D309E
MRNGSGEVTVRATSPDDRAALLAYLERLPDDDRRRRFFGSRALERHLDSWLALPARGGTTLVAMTDGEAGPRCVGEAGFAPRDDGSAEFAMSVDVEHRGGLGRALFGELRRRAAAAGFTALYGDVLESNAPMLGLLRRRGGATIERPDDSVVGIVVGTASCAPPWPDAGPGPRVLVEAPRGRWAGEAVVRGAGAQVAVCPGPEDRTPGEPCPLLTTGSCPLVDGADVVVHALPAGRRASETVRRTLLKGPVPVVVPEQDAGDIDPRRVVAILTS